MSPFTSADYASFVARYQSQLPVGSVLAAHIIAPGQPYPGSSFWAEGLKQIPNGPASQELNPIIYNIGSTSKTFTASMLATFQGGNQGNWGNVGDYLSAWNFPGDINSIPLINLAQYASGFDEDDVLPLWLPDVIQMAKVTDLVNALNNYANGASPPFALPQWPIGKYYTYSNLAFALLGLCVAGVDSVPDDATAGTLWNKALLGLIAQCGLSMPDTMLFQSLPNDLRAGMTGYQGSKPVTAALGNLRPESVVYAGAGGITSNLSDMSQWLLFNMGYPVGNGMQIPVKTQTTFFNGPAPSAPPGATNTYTGLGWHMSQPSVSPPWVFKNGGVSGHTSYMAFTSWATDGANPPASNTGIVVLLNYRQQDGDQYIQAPDATAIGPALMNFVLECTGQS